MNVRAVALPLIAAGIATGIWLMLPPADPMGPSQIPATTWRAGPEINYRLVGNYVDYLPETELRLSYACAEPRYVYVFSHSTEDGTLLLFPSPDILGSPSNPLTEGFSLLPGKLDDKQLAWTTRSEILATTTYVVVASKQRIDALEALIPNLRRWSNATLPNKAMLTTNPASGTEVKGKPRTPWPSELLQRAADRAIAETLVNGPMSPDDLPGVWTSSLRIRERKKAK